AGAQLHAAAVPPREGRAHRREGVERRRGARRRPRRADRGVPALGRGQEEEEGVELVASEEELVAARRAKAGKLPRAFPNDFRADLELEKKRRELVALAT